MKTLNKLSILALTSILVLSSCETTELDLTTNPNALNPSQASADLFMNGIQEDFAFFVNSMGDTGSRLLELPNWVVRDFIVMLILQVHSQEYGKTHTKV